MLKSNSGVGGPMLSGSVGVGSPMLTGGGGEGGSMLGAGGRPMMLRVGWTGLPDIDVGQAGVGSGPMVLGWSSMAQWRWSGWSGMARWGWGRLESDMPMVLEKLEWDNTTAR